MKILIILYTYKLSILTTLKVYLKILFFIFQFWFKKNSYKDLEL